jgi:hypothetical protein
MSHLASRMIPWTMTNPADSPSPTLGSPPVSLGVAGCIGSGRSVTESVVPLGTAEAQREAVGLNPRTLRRGPMWAH